MLARWESSFDWGFAGQDANEQLHTYGPILPQDIWERIADRLTAEECCRLTSASKDLSQLQPKDLDLSLRCTDGLSWLLRHCDRLQTLSLTVDKTCDVDVSTMLNDIFSAVGKDFHDRTARSEGPTDSPLHRLRTLKISHGNRKADYVKDLSPTWLGHYVIGHLIWQAPNLQSLCVSWGGVPESLPTRLARLALLTCLCINMFPDDSTGRRRPIANVMHGLGLLGELKSLHFSCIKRTPHEMAMDLSDCAKLQTLLLEYYVPTVLRVRPSCTVKVSISRRHWNKVWERIGQQVTHLQCNQAPINPFQGPALPSQYNQNYANLTILFLACGPWVPVVIDERFYNLKHLVILTGTGNNNVCLTVAAEVCMQTLMIDCGGSLQLDIQDWGKFSGTLESFRFEWGATDSDLVKLKYHLRHRAHVSEQVVCSKKHPTGDEWIDLVHISGCVACC